MTFPLLIPLGPYALHPHFVFEALAYFVGVRLYLRTRRADAVPEATRTTVLVGAALGAALGSKLMFWLEWPPSTFAHATDLSWLIGGKSIVGGLLGGWIGVELAKKRVGETRSTGDRFVVPLGVGMSIGRIGCFLTGLDDHTSGVATTLPWGIDFGDGVPRHPTQLYEMALLACVLVVLTRRDFAVRGTKFLAFMLAYLAFRFGVDFLKPDPRWIVGLSAIQVACFAGILYAATTLRRRLAEHASHPEEVIDG